MVLYFYKEHGLGSLLPAHVVVQCASARPAEEPVTHPHTCTVPAITIVGTAYHTEGGNS